MDNKKVLLNLGNVRITEYDELNLKVERLEEKINPQTKKANTNWRFKGYFRTVQKALEFITSNDLLINKDNVSNEGLDGYIKELQRVRELIQLAITNQLKVVK